MLASDDEVDNINRAMYRDIQTAMKKTTAMLEGLQCLMSLSRSLERIADHSTNIAEDVIYLVDGEIVRHGRHMSGAPKNAVQVRLNQIN